MKRLCPVRNYVPPAPNPQFSTTTPLQARLNQTPPTLASSHLFIPSITPSYSIPTHLIPTFAPSPSSPSSKSHHNTNPAQTSSPTPSDSPPPSSPSLPTTPPPPLPSPPPHHPPAIRIIDRPRRPTRIKVLASHKLSRARISWLLLFLALGQSPSYNQLVLIQRHVCGGHSVVSDVVAAEFGCGVENLGACLVVGGGMDGAFPDPDWRRGKGWRSFVGARAAAAAATEEV
jgi:hypothetical protein